MSNVNYVVRDSAGSARRGSFVEGDPSAIYVSFTKDVSLNLSAGDIASYKRSGNDLIVELKDGQTLVLNGYFDVGTTGEKSLFLSEEGEIVEVVLEAEGNGDLVATYQGMVGGEKWSPYDDLVFLDLADVQPVVAPLAAPLLGPLIAGGAAVAGGVAVVANNGDDGGPVIIQPTVDDPDATHIVGGTAANNATVTGTGAPESEVIVDIGGQTQTVIVTDGGTWTATFDVSGLPGDGVYDTSVSVVDPDGNTFDLDGPTVDIDVTAPLVAVASGTEATGDLVNAASHTGGATITGVGETGATVDVTIDGTTHSTVVDADGNWSVTFATSEITTGEYNTAITITSTDARGNSTTMSDVLVVDTVAPTADLGTVEGDDVISAAEASDGVTLTGSGEAGATVEVSFQGITRTATVDAGGSWSIAYAATEIAAGTYDSTVSITTTDAAGNSSTSSHSVHVDTEQSLSMNAEVGGDYVINATEQSTGVSFTGTAEPGSSVVVTLGTVSHAVTAGAGGSWSATFAPGDIPTGTYETTVTAVATDSAGNSETTTQTLRVDTENAVALDTTQAGDNVISGSEAAVGVTLTGTAEPGASVAVTMQGVTHTVTAGANGTWSAVFSTAEIPPGEYGAPVVVSSTDAAGNSSTTNGTVRVDTQTSVSIAPGQAGGDNLISAAEQSAGVSFTGTAEPGASVVVTLGTVSHSVTAGANGSWSATFASGDIPTGTYETTVTAVATDSAGNSETTTQTLRVDTENAVALDPTQAGDNVISGSEAAVGVTLTGTAEPGASVAVTMQGVTHTVTAGANGTWSAAFSAAEIPPGEYDAPVVVSSTDAAGNSSTTNGTVHVDTQTSVSIAAGQAGGDSIVNAAEAQAGVTFTGSAEPGASVQVTVAGITRTATVDGSGNWSALYANGSLPQGEFDTTIQVNATDAAGNTASSSSSIRVDTTAGEVALSPLPIEIDDVINAVERADGVVINGTATPGLMVTVGLGGATQQVIADAGGNWSITVPASSIPTGTQALPITASITDPAGNTASATDSVQLDTVVDNFVANTGAIEGDNIINATERADGVTVTGSVEPGSTVMVQLGGVTQAAVVDGVGNWAVTFAAGSIPQGTYTSDITVTATDAAGNTDVIRDTVQVDTEVQASVAADQTSDDVVNAVEQAAGLALTGTTEPGSTVLVDLMGVQRIATVDALGNWTANFEPADLPQGTYSATATVTATDPAGNVATLSESFDVDTEIESPNVDSVTFSGSDVWRIGTQDADGSYSVNTLEPNGAVGSPASTISQHPVLGTEFTFTSPVPDGTNLVVSRVDAAGNSSATLTVLEDGAGAATTVGHAGLGSFDIQALNLDYGENTNLVLTETQIRQLSDSSDTLTIHGGADDTVTVAGAVSTGQSQQLDGQAYNVYTLGNDGTTLLIEQDINVII